MSKLDPQKFYTNAIIVFFGLSALAGIFSILALMQIPTDEKNAWIAGYSPGRWLMIGMALGIGILFAGFAYKTWRDAEWNLKLPNIFMKLTSGRLLYFLWLSIGVVTVFILPYLYLYFDVYRFISVLMRLSPIVLYLLGIALIFLLLLTILCFFRESKDYVGIEKSWVGNITPFNIFLILATIIFLLVIGNLWGYWLKQGLWGKNNLPFVQSYYLLFNLDQEHNIPAFYSSIQLLMAGIFLGVITVSKNKQADKYIWSWLFLALIFLYLSADEWFMLHERWSVTMDSLFQFTGLLDFFPWLIIGIPLVVIFSMFFFRFYVHLPMKMKVLMGIAAFVYISGAIGLELAGGWFVLKFGFVKSARFVIYTFEEMFEMLGIAILIFALWTYLIVRIDHTDLVDSFTGV